jgi:hypothetical protein
VKDRRLMNIVHAGNAILDKVLISGGDKKGLFLEVVSFERYP